MIFARLQYLPGDSAVATAQNGGRPEFTGVEYLLTDIWAATAGAKEPHPARPEPPDKQQTPERAKAIAKGKRLAKKRRKDIDAGIIK